MYLTFEVVIGNALLSDWEGFNSHTIKVEKDYWQKDGLIEGIIDNFVIELGGIESSEKDDDTSDSSFAASEFAQPLVDNDSD